MAQQQDAWNPSLHPRQGGGRFGQSGNAPPPGANRPQVRASRETALAAAKNDDAKAAELAAEVRKLRQLLASLGHHTSSHSTVKKSVKASTSSKAKSAKGAKSGTAKKAKSSTTTSSKSGRTSSSQSSSQSVASQRRQIQGRIVMLQGQITTLRQNALELRQNAKTAYG